MATTSPGPGLSKVRNDPFASEQSIRLLSVLDGWWARLLERADVVSEGSVAVESDGSVYYGSTCLRCRPEDWPQTPGQPELRELAAVLLRHPHTRLRLLRLARREAVVRAGGGLEVMHAEIHGRLRRDAAGSIFDICIDVSARLAQLAGAVASD